MDNTNIVVALALLGALSVLNMAAVVIHQLALNSFERSYKSMQEMMLLLNAKTDRVVKFGIDSSGRTQKQLECILRVLPRSEAVMRALDLIDKEGAKDERGRET